MKKIPIPNDYSVFIVHFLSLLSEYDSEIYIPLIMNMKKDVMRLLSKLGYNFALSKYSATCCQDDTAEAHWLGIWDFAISTISSTSLVNLLPFILSIRKLFYVKKHSVQNKEVETAFKDFLVSTH